MHITSLNIRLDRALREAEFISTEEVAQIEKLVTLGEHVEDAGYSVSNLPPKAGTSAAAAPTNDTDILNRLIARATIAIATASAKTGNVLFDAGCRDACEKFKTIIDSAVSELEKGVAS